MTSNWLIKYVNLNINLFILKLPKLRIRLTRILLINASMLLFYS